MTPVGAFESGAAPMLEVRMSAARPGQWLRELQKRAQALSWFPAPLEGTGKAAQAGARAAPASAYLATAAVRLPPAGEALPRLRGELPPRAAEGAGHLHRFPRFSYEVGAATSMEDARGQALTVPKTNTLPADRASTSATSQRIGTAPRGPTRCVEPAVRVHAEEGVAGLHVWIGVDAHDPNLAAQAASLISGLLSAHPHRIATLVCNGTRLHAASDSLPPQEQPWPSAH